MAQNELTPSYLKEPIPQARMFLYGQRRENEIPCWTSRFLNSFYPDTIRSWNNIGMNTGTAVVLANLSQNYSTSSAPLPLPPPPPPPPKKSIFGMHDPCGIKLLFQDTPSAICEEDTIHFITECALFATIRTNLMRSISNILTHNNLEHLSHAERTQLYLHGHSTLGKTLNCLVLQASIKLTLRNCELPSSPLHLHNPMLTFTTYHYLYYHLLYPLGMAHVFGIPVGCTKKIVLVLLTRYLRLFLFVTSSDEVTGPNRHNFPIMNVHIYNSYGICSKGRKLFTFGRKCGVLPRDLLKYAYENASKISSRNSLTPKNRIWCTTGSI